MKKQALYSLRESEFGLLLAATGQEPYSIAMRIAEMLYDFPTWDIQILGTDISPSAVEQASRGIYNKWEIGRGMTPGDTRQNISSNLIRILGKSKDEIRSMCSFKLCNLFEPFDAIGPFDLVFCRNVAILFYSRRSSASFRAYCR